MDILELIEQKENIREEQKSIVKKSENEIEDVFLNESILRMDKETTFINNNKTNKVMVKKR